jgi:hypothetical protein
VTFDEIISTLGAEVVQDVQEAVEAAYIASRASAEPYSGRALEDLLIALLVAVTVTPDTHAASGPRTANCVRRFQDLADETRMVHAEVGRGGSDFVTPFPGRLFKQ